MTEARKAKMEKALEYVARGGVVLAAGGVEVTDGHGGAETISADGTCTCGEERCVHGMAHEVERTIARINNNDTQEFLRSEPAEMLLAATVICAARANEERDLAESAHTPVPAPCMPYASVTDAIQHHQRAQRAAQERAARDDAVKLANHRAYYAGAAFASLLKELGVRGREEVFSYSYGGRDYLVEVYNKSECGARVMLAEDARAPGEA